MKSYYSLNLTYKFYAFLNLQIRFSREKFEPGPGFEPRISRSGPDSNFFLENLI